MKRILVIVLLFLTLVGAGSYIFYFLPMEKEIKAAMDVPISNIDIASLKDGVYRGFHIDYGVEAVISGHKLQSIKIIKNRDSNYARKAESVIDHVMENQSLQVDLVSGATSSSRGILKAVENALKSEPEE